jgi:hypothetical protein
VLFGKIEIYRSKEDPTMMLMAQIKRKLIEKIVDK